MNAVYITCCDCGKKYIRNGSRQKRCVVCQEVYRKEYKRSPKVKAYMKKYQKKYHEEYKQSPKYKAYQKKYQKAYNKLLRDKLKFFRTIAIMGKISKAF
jgi:hypothetical protein